MSVPPNFCFCPLSRRSIAIAIRPKSADFVAKVFLGWRTKILRAADALYARQREGPYRFIQNRSRTSVVALKSDAAAEKSKDQLLRDFPGRSIVDFCNKICQDQTHAPAATHRYSITSSARESSVDGNSRPRALAVLRFMMSSNLVGCSTGRSAGRAPLRISIVAKLLATLAEQQSLDEGKREAIRKLLAEDAKVKADEFVKIFTSEGDEVA